MISDYVENNIDRIANYLEIIAEELSNLNMNLRRVFPEKDDESTKLR
jgi:hypothetical protein